MTNAERIEALEAQVALLTAAVSSADPVVAAKMLAAPAEEVVEVAPVEAEAEAEPTDPA